MRSNAIDLSLRDGTHANLIKSSRKESSKGRNEDDVPVSTAQPNPYSDHVLLGNETLHKPVGEGILVGQGKSGVLGVPIQSHDSVKVLP